MVPATRCAGAASDRQPSPSTWPPVSSFCALAACRLVENEKKEPRGGPKNKTARTFRAARHALDASPGESITCSRRLRLRKRPRRMRGAANPARGDVAGPRRAAVCGEPAIAKPRRGRHKAVRSEHGSLPGKRPCRWVLCCGGAGGGDGFLSNGGGGPLHSQDMGSILRNHGASIFTVVREGWYPES